jgi:hypothetical protein
MAKPRAKPSKPAPAADPSPPQPVRHRRRSPGGPVTLSRADLAAFAVELESTIAAAPGADSAEGTIPHALGLPFGGLLDAADWDEIRAAFGDDLGMIVEMGKEDLRIAAEVFVRALRRKFGLPLAILG